MGKKLPTRPAFYLRKLLARSGSLICIKIGFLLHLLAPTDEDAARSRPVSRSFRLVHKDHLLPIPADLVSGQKSAPSCLLHVASAMNVVYSRYWSVNKANLALSRPLNFLTTTKGTRVAHSRGAALIITPRLCRASHSSQTRPIPFLSLPVHSFIFTWSPIGSL